jgi:hypothetical protein
MPARVALARIDVSLARETLDIFDLWAKAEGRTRGNLMAFLLELACRLKYAERYPLKLSSFPPGYSWVRSPSKAPLPAPQIAKRLVRFSIQIPSVTKRDLSDWAEGEARSIRNLATYLLEYALMLYEQEKSPDTLKARGLV